MEIIPGFFVSLSGYSAVAFRSDVRRRQNAGYIIDRKEFKR